MIFCWQRSERHEHPEARQRRMVRTDDRVLAADGLQADACADRRRIAPASRIPRRRQPPRPFPHSRRRVIPMSYSTPRSALDIASAKLDETLADYFGSTGAGRALKRRILRRDLATLRDIQNATARKITAGLWCWAFNNSRRGAGG